MKTVIAIITAGGVMLGGFALNAQTVKAQNDTAQPVALLSIADASTIALAQKAGTITEIELERERGQSVYEVKIRTADGAKAKVIIGAETGEVIAITERTASRMGKWWDDDHDGDHSENDHDDDHDDDHDRDDDDDARDDI